MAQLQLPVFPEGVITLTPDLGVCSRDGQVTCFYGNGDGRLLASLGKGGPVESHFECTTTITFPL